MQSDKEHEKNEKVGGLEKFLLIPFFRRHFKKFCTRPEKPLDLFNGKNLFLLACILFSAMILGDVSVLCCLLILILMTVVLYAIGRVRRRK